MARIKGERLYVNLSASQVRKRLKGLGFGVRKVETAGRNQAVIIHTATGEHRRELLAILEDVIEPAQKSVGASAPVPVGELRNLGPATCEWLAEVGIATQADLQRMGAVLAYRLVRQRHPQASLNLLWALAGALADRGWRDFSSDERQQLREEAGEG